MGGKQQKEEKEMIEELKEQIYGWDQEGKPSAQGIAIDWKFVKQ